jgi:hypothetical protein
MPQKVLLPSDNPIAGAEWRPTGPIPGSVREFGKFPNIEQWLPADLLLVSSIEPDAVTRQIINAQVRGGFSADDARWQHAAVYLGEGYVIEATLHGVRYAPIYPYLGKHRLRVRRPLDLNSDERWRIAIQADVQANQKYAIRSILSLYARSFKGLWTKQKSDVIKSTEKLSDLFPALLGFIQQRYGSVAHTYRCRHDYACGAERKRGIW